MTTSYIKVPMQDFGLHDPPLDARGRPVGDFQPMLDDFAIGNEGTPLRALYDRDDHKAWHRMCNLILTAYERFVHTAGDLTIAATQEYFAKSLLDDMVANKSDYELLLEPLDMYLWSERLCGILGTLATIYRQRESFAECRLLLEGWYVHIINKHKHHVETRIKLKVPAPLDRPQSGYTMAECLRVLTYKYHRIRLNLATDLYMRSIEPYINAGDSLRIAMQEEIDTGVGPDSDNNEFSWMLSHYFKKPCNSKGLKAVSDQSLNDIGLKQVAQAMARQNKTNPAVYMEANRHSDAAVLKQCATCGEKEEFIGLLLACGGCRSKHYCTKECQKKDWKSHKKVCKLLNEARERSAVEQKELFYGKDYDAKERAASGASKSESISEMQATMAD